MDKFMNHEGFSGKAQAYAAARPGYPDAAIEYIRSLVPSTAVFADIGAGTGKFTELVAQYGYIIFAVEPNADMREQLAITLAVYHNAKIISSAAENTTLPDQSVDIIVCSQSLGWLNLELFRAECNRIGKSGATIVSLFNETPGDAPNLSSHRYTSRQASELFFCNPTIQEYSNPVFYTKERWFQMKASISDNPKPSEPEYDRHIIQLNDIFDRNNIDGLIRMDFTTIVYSEKLK